MYDTPPSTGDADISTDTDQLVNAQTRLLLDRRNLLRVGGMVALAGGGAVALAACAPAQTTGGTPSGAPTSAAPTSAAPSSAAPSSAAPSSAAPSSATPSAAPSSAASSAPVPRGPSVKVADVPVGSGVIMDEPNDYVITQPTKGKFKAFTATCTHQGCRVSELRGDKIFCACHDSEFAITDGAPVAGPADQPLEEFKTTVSGGKVVVDE